MNELDKRNNMSDEDKMINLERLAQKNGYLFSGILQEINEQEEEDDDGGGVFDVENLSEDDEHERGVVEDEEEDEINLINRMYSSQGSSNRELRKRLRRGSSIYFRKMRKAHNNNNNNINNDASFTPENPFTFWLTPSTTKTQQVKTQMDLQTWGILYCGGNKFIHKNLRYIKRKYGLASYESEKFQW